LEATPFEACGVDVKLLDGEKKDALKHHDSYTVIVSLFTNLGIDKTNALFVANYPIRPEYGNAAYLLRRRRVEGKRCAVTNV
jgi:hypothetical protein|tara:strand:- start:3055 stop:3300 length:246 start_codon:yes stop_codon:yes gene_type:complete